MGYLKMEEYLVGELSSQFLVRRYEEEYQAVEEDGDDGLCKLHCV